MVDKDIEIRDIFILLMSNKIRIFLVTFLVTIIGICGSFLIKPEYTSTSKMISRTSNSSAGQLSEIALLAGLPLNNSKVELSNYLDQIIRDELFLQPVKDKKWFYKDDSLYLHQIWEMEPDTTKSNWEFIFNKKQIDRLANGNIIRLSKDAKSGVITLSTTTDNERLSFELNCFIVTKITHYILNTMSTFAREKRIFIEKRIDNIKYELLKSENKLTNFRDRNRIVSSPEANIEEMRLLRDVTLNQEIFIQLQKQYELAKIEESNDQSTLEVIVHPQIPYHKSKPDRKMISIISFLIGLILSFAYIFIRETIIDKNKGL